MLLEEYNETATMELFREEGRVEGEILQAIKMYRKLVHYSDEQILDAIQTGFDLSREVAEQYLAQA